LTSIQIQPEKPAMLKTHHGESIVLASNNAGKVREINALLAAEDIHVIPQDELGVAEAEETGLSFVENAILKARNAAAHSGWRPSPTTPVSRSMP
jgi:XTP/dITP diphosphohydrolase